jgi:hypothetical protein
MLAIVMSGKSHYYYFEKNSEMLAEIDRIVEMMK